MTSPLVEADGTVRRTADTSADPVALAGEALGAAVRSAAIVAEQVQLVLVACSDPGQWSEELHAPLLDGKFSADVIRRLLLDNGLTSAVPFGVSVGPTDVADLAQEYAGALASAEGLHAVLVVAVWVEDRAGVSRLVAAAWPGGRRAAAS